jgi:circadian clock protein KaiC
VFVLTATSDVKAEETAGVGVPTSKFGGLSKAPTGISGLDELTGGGLPRGRPTLVCGPAGCGKTLIAMEFLVRGITEFNEPGVFISFEETTSDLTSNFASLGFDLAKLEADGCLKLDHIDLIHGDMEETGDWDLDGLFLRIGAAIDAVGAKRVVLDTMETLFGAFTNSALLRSELARLCAFLKQRGVTAVITAEPGETSLTRHGIEEYVSDCVIALDHRVTEQTSIRRLRILKYRGSFHGTNEYPFLIGESGVSVLPITSLGLRHEVSPGRMSTGIPRLDSMLGHGGFYKGSTIYVSGTSGTGKTTLAAQFCNATCARGERVVFFSFDESQDAIIRNMSSVGLDLQKWVDARLLQFECFRPGLLGLEWHLFRVHECVRDFDPSVVVMDPISAGSRGTADSSGRFLEGKRRDIVLHELDGPAKVHGDRAADDLPRRHLDPRGDAGRQR